MKADASKLRQYLLKNLSDAETEAMDLQFFDNDEFESAVCLAEDDLIEDYLDETLSPAEITLFQNNFLVTNRRRKNLAFLRELKAKIGAGAETEKPVTLLERLAKLFRPKFPQIVVFASLAVVFVVFGWWLLIGSGGGKTSEIAALNRRDLSDLTAYQNASKLSLNTDVLRGNESAKSLEKDLLTENVLLRLDVRENAEAIPQVNIFRNETSVITIENARVYKTQNGAELRLLLPASALEKGVYRVEYELEKRKTIYNFTIR